MIRHRRLAALATCALLPLAACGEADPELTESGSGPVTQIRFERVDADPGRTDDAPRLRAEFTELAFSDGVDKVYLSGRIEVADVGDRLVGQFRVRDAALEAERPLEIRLDDFKLWQAGYTSMETTRPAGGRAEALPVELARCAAGASAMLELRLSRAPVDSGDGFTRLVQPGRDAQLFGGQIGARTSAEAGGYGTADVADATFARAIASLRCGDRRFRADVAGFVGGADDAAPDCPPGRPCPI